MISLNQGSILQSLHGGQIYNDSHVLEINKIKGNLSPVLVGSYEWKEDLVLLCLL